MTSFKSSWERYSVRQRCRALRIQPGVHGRLRRPHGCIPSARRRLPASRRGQASSAIALNCSAIWAWRLQNCTRRQDEGCRQAGEQSDEKTRLERCPTDRRWLLTRLPFVLAFQCHSPRLEGGGWCRAHGWGLPGHLCVLSRDQASACSCGAVMSNDRAGARYEEDTLHAGTPAAPVSAG